MTTILPSRNEAWGFFGTVRHHVDSQSAWDAAFTAISSATESAIAEGVRDFLDSRLGRHFADTVADGLAAGHPLRDAITAAITRWNGWRIDARTSRDHGIPKGTPYLTGWVMHFEIMAEADLA